MIEVAIVLVLFVVVGGALLTAFVSGQLSLFHAETSVQLQREGRRAFDVMGMELREAGPVAGPTLTPPVVPPGPGPNQLNFQIARGYNLDATCANAICWGSENGNTQWLHYAAVDNPALPAGNDRQLVRCVTAGFDDTPLVVNDPDCVSYRVLANNVQGIRFDTTDLPAVRIDLWFQYAHARLPQGTQVLGTAAEPMTQTVFLRNL